jgi:VWFA-related protein
VRRRRPVPSWPAAWALALLAGGLLPATAAHAQSGTTPPADEPSPAPPTVRSRKGFAIRITTPARDDFRFGRADIEAQVSAADPALVTKVEFYVDDRLVFIDTEAPYRCTFDFGGEPRSWVIRATAFHREGVTVSDTIILKRVVLNYSVQVNRVILFATPIVRDGDLPFTGPLKKEDLVLEEDGARQTIIDFYKETRPVSLALVLDSSGSMQPAIEKVHGAAGRFVKAMRPGDRGLVIDFDEKVYLLQDLTEDKEALAQAIASTNALGGTALYDALYAAYRKLRSLDGRKAAILLSDGEDTDSRLAFRRIVDEAKLSDVIIYSIGLNTTVMDLALRKVLKTLADETGGRAFFPKGLEELEGTYERIADELGSVYYITYEPTNPNWDGRWRTIKLTAPGKGLDLRTRSGYYAVRKGIR